MKLEDLKTAFFGPKNSRGHRPLTRPCGHGRFAPNGLYRPLQEGDHYMGTDFSDPPPDHNWMNYAYTHTCDSDDDVCFVILSCIEDCPNGDDCTEGLE